MIAVVRFRGGRTVGNAVVDDDRKARRGRKTRGVRTTGHQRRSNVLEVMKFMIDTVSVSEKNVE